MKINLVTTSGKEPMKTLSANVGSHIINSAQPCNFNRCMVAEAIQEKYPDATYIYVDTSIIRLTRDGLRYWFIPPQSVKDFIIKFDRREHVKPFRFTTPFLARVTPSGFWQTHQADNRTNPNKRYKASEKRRKYGKRKRINGVCLRFPQAA